MADCRLPGGGAIEKGLIMAAATYQIDDEANHGRCDQANCESDEKYTCFALLWTGIPSFQASFLRAFHKA